MIKYRSLTIIIGTFLLLTFIGCDEKNIDTSKKETDSKVITDSISNGDYVQFGRYDDEPILWKCVDTANGAMLVSEYILTLKAFSAAQSGVVAPPGGSLTVDESGNIIRDTTADLRQMYGSNEWHNSNLREWLNSDSKVVNYTTQPPIKEAVYEGYNPYADESGFLTNFTESEKKKIKEVTHDAVKDRVYILSKDEVNKYIGSTPNERKKHMVYEVDEDVSLDYECYKIRVRNIWWYWTRTPSTESSFAVFFVNDNGNLHSAIGACIGKVGVVPALNLHPVIPISGNGTKEEPYILQ